MTKSQTPWRTGASIGRTIYVGDTLIGMMDTADLAAQVVEDHNLMLSWDETDDPKHAIAWRHLWARVEHLETEMRRHYELGHYLPQKGS